MLQMRPKVSLWFPSTMSVPPMFTRSTWGGDRSADRAPLQMSYDTGSGTGSCFENVTLMSVSGVTAEYLCVIHFPQAADDITRHFLCYLSARSSVRLLWNEVRTSKERLQINILEAQSGTWGQTSGQTKRITSGPSLGPNYLHPATPLLLCLFLYQHVSGGSRTYTHHHSGTYWLCRRKVSHF